MKKKKKKRRRRPCTSSDDDDDGAETGLTTCSIDLLLQKQSSQLILPRIRSRDIFLPFAPHYPEHAPFEIRSTAGGGQHLIGRFKYIYIQLERFK